MSDCFKTYNKTLKELIDLVSNELPRNPLIDTINRKYRVAVSTDRTLLLTESGKEIFAYRKYIAEDRWDELINKEWEQQSGSDSVEGMDRQSIHQVITLLRDIWSGYDQDEKKYVQKLIKQLLSEYTRYLMRG